jgi:glycosyltransferase involved in cell wall biosynthesis
MKIINTVLTLKDLPAPPQGKIGWPWIERSSQLPDKMTDGSAWPHISIVTPSYNQGQFIEETIRSVLLQGYPNLEYIIIDGGSTDNTVEIIEKYESWISYWVSEKDSGQSDALNKGFAIGDGQICAYINSDDIFLPNALSKVSLAYAENPEFKWIAFSVLCGERLAKSSVWHPYAAKIPYFVVNQTIAQPGVFGYSRKTLV